MDDMELDYYLEAGKIAREVLHSSAAEIKPGVLMADIFDLVVDRIESAGAQLSFPPNISYNEVAAHDTPAPDDERIFSDGDLIKLDIGTHIEGYIADTATTINLGNHEKLCEACEASLAAAINVVRPDTSVQKIGAAVEETITSYGFKPIVNLAGHQVARYSLHHGVSIPNTGMFGSEVLKMDDVIAIEPFATTGTGVVYDVGKPEIFQVIGNAPVRSPTGRKVLKKAAETHGMNFSRRWLSVPKAELVIPTLLRQGNFREYYPLSDVPGSFVAQFEHTVIVCEDEPIVTTRK